MNNVELTSKHVQILWDLDNVKSYGDLILSTEELEWMQEYGEEHNLIFVYDWNTLFVIWDKKNRDKFYKIFFANIAVEDIKITWF